jgi:hypothetical protein
MWKNITRHTVYPTQRLNKIQNEPWLCRVSVPSCRLELGYGIQYANSFSCSLIPSQTLLILVAGADERLSAPAQWMLRAISGVSTCLSGYSTAPNCNSSNCSHTASRSLSLTEQFIPTNRNTREDDSLLGYSDMWSHWCRPTFQRCLLHPS